MRNLTTEDVSQRGLFLTIVWFEEALPFLGFTVVDPGSLKKPDN